MSDDDAIVKEFLVESYENLDRLDQNLVVLEKEPGNRETLASIFRTIHTIKGTSGFLAFNRLESLTHVGENLLARLRDGLLALNPEITSALLAMVDAVREMLKSIEETGKEGDRQDQALIARLTSLLETQPGNATAQPTVPASNPAAPPGADAGETPVEKAAVKTDKLEAALPEQEPVEPYPSQETPVEKSAGKTPEVADAAAVHQQAKGQGASDSTIRVDVGQLDRLMNRVGELVLLRNQIVQYTNSTEDSELLGTSQRLNLLTTELQESVMKTRMQPIGNIWSKFPRTVRDVALGCGKQVRIEMEGKETELDKTIIEAIKDPLTHLVRNAVDHGIEPPEGRHAAGKNPEGLLFLRAFHEGGQVNIEVTDDGAGLNYEKLKKKAIQKALISAEQAARMTERDIANLIFLPGFSTAEKVTNVSGRGVGMDVVKTNIEKIGGTVDIQSTPGRGSTVRMKIPLTLAIIPALIVTTSGDRYAIPQVSLLELVRLEGEQARKGIELVNGAPVYRLRGKLLPLVHLNRELKMDSGTASQSIGTEVLAKDQEFDFSLARDKHRQWMNTLQQVLENKRVMTADQAGSHEKCALGQWLYDTALEQYRTIREMQTLEATHKSFHDSVHEVLRLKEQQDGARAEQELSHASQLSAKIMELLTVVEAQVRQHQNINIVVLRADDRQFGLVVDEINDTEEIVVKPLSKQLKSINTYAGATIMGDGKVALILDVMGLAQRANVIGDARGHGLSETEEQAKASAETAVAERNVVLLFQHGEHRQMAIDLSLVARLEEFPRDSVEIAGEHEVVQYRGQIMPLVRVSEVLDDGQHSDSTAQQTLHVVVYSDQGRSVGLVVDHILDIVEESFVMQRHAGRTGVLGSAVIQKRVTDIVDVPGLIAAAKGNQLFAGTQV
jgi:two-component system, chemotaxis family, sensor kinase CheA